MPLAPTLRWVLAGYDRRSALALALALGTYAAVGYRWQHLIDPRRGMDWLLAGIWVFMTALLTWRLSPRADLRLVFVGLCGGAVIEWWGTRTELWTYFTRERPPAWIVPAWPVAALTIHRLPALVGHAWPRLHTLGAAYWPLMLGFVALMVRFLWPAIDDPSSQVVVALLLAVPLLGRRPHRDVAIFLAGAALGLFLEYWGTSRRCWTYYTRQIPPPEAVLAHGFAAVAFARADDLLGAVLARLDPRARLGAGGPPAG
jgi:putative Ca2+/H+ antiporter (TMEM165/GDT1 family)